MTWCMRDHERPLGAVAVTLATALALLVLCAGCGGLGATQPDDSTTSGPPDPAARATTTAAAPDPASIDQPGEPELFEGSTEAFYEVPDPLPDGGPGDLIRYQVLDSERTSTGGEQPARERTTVRVMYHSNDAAGTDRATTGIVTFPHAEPPVGGWPVVSFAHGTAGMASRCAPSRDGFAAPGWGIDGVWAATDYVGLGPVGEIHPYLSKSAEGNAVIDIVRAAAQVPASGAGRRWVSVGHSQGGHAALAAHELSDRRAPGLELEATVAVAPAAGIDVSYGIDRPLMDVLTMMQLYGARSEHDGIDLRRYLRPEVIDEIEVFETGCVDEISFELVSADRDDPFAVDTRSTEPAASLLRANRIGTRAVPGVPVLLVSGSLDPTVVPERVDALFGRLCTLGQQTFITRVPGADHSSIISLAVDEVTDFLTAALAGSAGSAGTDSC